MESKPGDGTPCFTRGPWTWTDDGVCPDLYGDEGQHVLFTRVSGADLKDADRALIASAPDLFAALDRVVALHDALAEDHEEQLLTRDLLRDARAALAKARGEAA